MIATYPPRGVTRTSLRRLGAVLGAVAVLLALSVNRGDGGDDTRGQATILRVLLPKQHRAWVMIDGKTVTGKTVNSKTGKTSGVTTGKVREIVAPPLANGKKEYQVTAVWRTNDYTRFLRSRKVAPKPGGTVVVDLRSADPKNPDRIQIRYVPTPDDIVERMCKLAGVGKDDVVFDLGCGDGRIVIAAVADFKAKKGVGVDLNPERIRESIANAKAHGVSDKVTFRVQDVLKIDDLSSASVVMLYMGEDVNLRLRPILQKSLKPGARIVSHRFGMGDWKPDKTEVIDGHDGLEYRLHLWTIKKK